ncbi:hypothetical protein [Romeriopsis navalis]|uniref:hypothetical protein n=1 Tax=Romeriopsis navalis TaxID=2992132 RepID=UPI0021F91397|nr:hypothetical protein [Romeriopsis navalis]
MIPVLFLLFVIALVAWALHLMEQAVARQEFSLMLAGTLVASASAALVGVYFVMGNYMGYVNQLDKTPAEMEQAYESIQFYIDQAELQQSRADFLADSPNTPTIASK